MPTCAYCGHVAESAGPEDHCPQCGTYYSEKVRERVEAEAKANTPPPKSVVKILFSFRGRIPRRTFAIYYGATFLLLAVMWTLASEVSVIFTPPFIAILIVTRWSEWALLIKRNKDFDRDPGFIVFGTLVPILGQLLSIIFLIECLDREGTVGKNRFGFDPLGRVNTSDFGLPSETMSASS